MRADQLELYPSVIHTTRYARWMDTQNRRETMPETVQRYIDFFTARLEKMRPGYPSTALINEVRDAMNALDIQPSMRSFMTAGKALDSAPAANFNCTALPVDSVLSIAEHMYVLMCGCGSGFSVEKQFIDKLPAVAELRVVDRVITVEDSREGWADALKELLECLYAGMIPSWDVSKLRQEGARLKTFGGYSSGPRALVTMFKAVIALFSNAEGRKLRSIELFSIMCHVAQAVVVGGVRRSATICLFDNDDVEMRNAKTGNWWVNNSHYALANISAVFTSRPSETEFTNYWSALSGAGSGEPGIFNRGAVWEVMASQGRKIHDAAGNKIPILTNPCCEILLRPYQMCNLTCVSIRPGDSLSTLLNKARLAAILGTWQATITDFRYLRNVWKENCDEERLLGVSLSGIMDHEVLNTPSEESKRWFNALRETAVNANRAHAELLGIPVSASVTTVKPGGNSSELHSVSSGIHPRYSPYYIRTVRQSAGDPVTDFLKTTGIPWEVSKQNSNDIVLSFPIKSPEGAVCAPDRTALQQLEHWLHVRREYTTHTVSCTIYVRKHEWGTVGAWVYANFNAITGLSFLPYDDHIYEQAVYQPVTAEVYAAAAAKMPKVIDWNGLRHFEQTDTTTVSQELACAGGACELR